MRSHPPTLKLTLSSGHNLRLSIMIFSYGHAVQSLSQSGHGGRLWFVPGSPAHPGHSWRQTTKRRRWRPM